MGSYEDAQAKLNKTLEEDRSVELRLSEREVEVLRQTLDTIFRSVRSGEVGLVKRVAGIRNMADAAHLISVRNALGEIE